MRSYDIAPSDTGKWGIPVCDVEFEPGGMAISPKAYCCEECRKDAWIIKRAAKLLKRYSDKQVLEILRLSYESKHRWGCIAAVLSDKENQIPVPENY